MDRLAKLRLALSARKVDNDTSVTTRRYSRPSLRNTIKDRHTNKDMNGESQKKNQNKTPNETNESLSLLAQVSLEAPIPVRKFKPAKDKVITNSERVLIQPEGKDTSASPPPSSNNSINANLNHAEHGCSRADMGLSSTEKTKKKKKKKKSSKKETSTDSKPEKKKKSRSKKRDKVVDEFREKVAFAFDLYRRQSMQQNDDSSEEDGFLPLMGLTLDEDNLHSLKRLAKKNADLRLTKLHLYQLNFAQHSHFEDFLGIFQRYFPTLSRIVLSSNSLRIQDIDAITKRFRNLAELCIYSGDGFTGQEFEDAFSPKWDETFGRLASGVAREVTLPHMGGRLPEGIYRGLGQSGCIVQRLHLKLDSEKDVERLVGALCQGRSVRKLRLESATCRSCWLDELLMQYDLLEQLELYHCQSTHKENDDRLAAWMI